MTQTCGGTGDDDGAAILRIGEGRKRWVDERVDVTVGGAGELLSADEGVWGEVGHYKVYVRDVESVRNGSVKCEDEEGRRRKARAIYGAWWTEVTLDLKRGAGWKKRICSKHKDSALLGPWPC